jgi:hypothetical protein
MMHLHRDLKPMIKNSLGNYIQKEPDNGFAGAIDLTPYFKNIFIKDFMDTLQKQFSFFQSLLNAWKLLVSIRLIIKK